MSTVCPVCKNLNKTSTLVRVFTGQSDYYSVSKESYWDEEGRDHHHSNTLTISVYRCSEGHESIERKYSKCYTCNYNHNRDSFEQSSEEWYL